MSQLTTATAAERHRRIADEFAKHLALTADWDAPTPVVASASPAGWVAADVPAHLIDWFTDFLAAGGIDLPENPHTEPTGRWEAHAAAIQELLDSPRADDSFSHPMAGTHRLTDAIDRFYTADIFMHTWDLARAHGGTPDLDADYAQQLLGGMAGIEELLRSSGQYGPAVPTSDVADPVTRLVGFIGRDPAWSPQG